ncbi:hypothetical protein DENSPDRAFT_886964 [Dentipellis sp. KUC8613]|nr:hypothetical protein DENSPDRAFT_886964 [Dentipellis sp. KUC8613]
MQIREWLGSRRPPEAGQRSHNNDPTPPPMTTSQQGRKKGKQRGVDRTQSDGGLISLCTDDEGTEIALSTHLTRTHK